MSIKENEVLNIFDKEVAMLQSWKGMLGMRCLFNRSVEEKFDVMAFASSIKGNTGRKIYFDPAIYPNNKAFDCEGWSKLHLDITKKAHNEGYTLSLKSSNMSESYKWPYAKFICSYGRTYEGKKLKLSEWDGDYREHSISNDRKNNRNDGLKLDRKR